MIDNISWLAIYPEILLLVMACVIALVDLGVKSPRRTGTYVLTLLTLGVVAVLQGMYASDRKSTRLNSSHLVISYAVFCLKKKKTSITSGSIGSAWTSARSALQTSSS